MRLINLGIPAFVASIALSVFLPSGKPNLPDGHWESADSYVYYTAENAIFGGESGGVAYFETSDGNVWGAYVWDSGLQDGDKVVLTFENRETRAEYYHAEEYGEESETRVDNARIVAIEN